MFSLTLENNNGDQLTFEQNSAFTVVDIQGLNPPDATINTSAVALLDGERYNGAKVNMRQINVAFAIEVNAAYNRIEVYKVLKSKQAVRLYYVGDYRDVYIDGYIQSIDISYFEKKQIVTCSILCPEPYFEMAQKMIDNLSTVINAFHFPFYGTGGVGKNLLENELIDSTRNGVTATLNDDGSVTVDGTASANTYFAVSGGYGSGKVPLPDWLIKGNTYRISGDYVRIFFYDEESNTLLSSNTNSTFTIPDEAVYYGVFVSIMSNQTVSNYTVYPMITTASITDTTYEQYEILEKNIVLGYIDPLASIIVDNVGDVETGLILTLIADGTIVNPKIYDTLTNEFIGINYEFEAGDEVTIDTRRGQKGITLLRDGVEYNIFNSLMKNSVWLQLPASGSVYTFVIESGNVDEFTVVIAYYPMYEGV